MINDVSGKVNSLVPVCIDRGTGIRCLFLQFSGTAPSFDPIE